VGYSAKHLAMVFGVLEGRAANRTPFARPRDTRARATYAREHVPSRCLFGMCGKDFLAKRFWLGRGAPLHLDADRELGGFGEIS